MINITDVITIKVEGDRQVGKSHILNTIKEAILQEYGVGPRIDRQTEESLHTLNYNLVEYLKANVDRSQTLKGMLERFNEGNKTDKDFIKSVADEVDKVYTEIYKARDEGRFVCSIYLSHLTDRTINKIADVLDTHGFEVNILSGMLTVGWLREYSEFEHRVKPAMNVAFTSVHDACKKVLLGHDESRSNWRIATEVREKTVKVLKRLDQVKVK